MKQTTQITLLNSIKLLKSRSVRIQKMFPLSGLTTSILKPFSSVNTVALGRWDRVKERVRITHNLLVHIQNMEKNHGTAFTIKWLKACTVALQKYLGGDPLKSLRSLEPNLPLPRLINGCPAYINKRDRELMRMGNSNISRFWLTQFQVYRILKGPYFPKLGSITDPFNGRTRDLLELVSLRFNPFVPFLDKVDFRGPTTLFLSHKSSPSSSLSYQGILVDFALLKYGSTDLRNPSLCSEVFVNILHYLNILKSGRIPTKRILSLFSSLDSLLLSIKESNLRLRVKSSFVSHNGLSQFAVKEESAGKLRIFAIIDSISQSVLRPLHDFLFEVLRKIPNDGTFDQDASVKRSTEKFEKFGVAYSFDLSSATDRLPVDLTASILEQMVGIKGFGYAWKSLLVNRDFSFTESINKKYFAGKAPKNIRYSVGQPMGGLSSWAGLAITHHWILQLCSSRLHNLGWEERYEILGDDIVIFDDDLAKAYLFIMKGLGVEINISKSINRSRSGFEFAKRTIINGVDVSAVTLQSWISATSLGAKVINTFTWAQKGLVNSLPHFAHLLTHLPGNSTFRHMSKVGLPALSLLNVLWSKDLVQLRIVLDSIVNPKYLDFDFERSKFDLPLISLLGYMLDILQGKEPKYPFSKESDRREFSSDYEGHLAAVILQEALSKVKTLARDYNNLTKAGALTLVKGKVPPLLESQLHGFFEDLIIDLSKCDPYDLVDEIEDKLYRHAKYPIFSVSEALSELEKVNSLVFKFTFKTEISRIKYEKDSSPILTLFRKSEGNISIPYWEIPTLSY